MAVHLLYALADLMGISYEEINIWIFVIVGPLLLLASLFANVVLWRRRKRSRWTEPVDKSVRGVTTLSRIRFLKSSDQWRKSYEL